MNFIVVLKLQNGWIRATITASIHQDDADSFVQNNRALISCFPLETQSNWSFLTFNLIESKLSFKSSSQIKCKDKDGENDRKMKSTTKVCQYNQTLIKQL